MPMRQISKSARATKASASVVAAVLLLLSILGISLADNTPRNVQSFETGFECTFGSFNMDVSNEGRGVSLVLSKQSGSGFRSKDSYLYGSFGAKMKLVPANSAGVVVSFYLSSETANHDEIDFEFLGNVSGEPWILQTNVFASGFGGREERVYLWFDPSKERHEYWVLWNEKHIVFYVDDTPIREHKNNELKLGVPYPQYQPMALFSSIFDGSDWATRQGLDRIDWSGSPFTASYEKFEINACRVGMVGDSVGFCRAGDHHKYLWERDEFLTLGPRETMLLREARRKYMVYSYCSDTARHSRRPRECGISD